MTVLFVLLTFAAFLALDAWSHRSEPVRVAALASEREEPDLMRLEPVWVAGFQVPDGLHFHRGHTGGKATRADLLEYAARYPDACGLLFDAPPSAGLPGGTGQTFDWDALPRDLPRPLVLSGGLTAANVGEAIRRLRPWAVDVSSGVEAIGPGGAPVRGTKDPARIVPFIEEVRHADD